MKENAQEEKQKKTQDNSFKKKKHKINKNYIKKQKIHGMKFPSKAFTLFLEMNLVLRTNNCDGFEDKYSNRKL